MVLHSISFKLKMTITVILISVIFLLSFVVTPYDRTVCVKANDGVNNDKMIALTFDDGPDQYTQKLLDGLKINNVKASFFVLGKKAEKNPEIIRQMNNDGHLIGNHTYSHIDFLKAKKLEVLNQLNETDDIIENIIGEKTLFYRPPYGHYLGTTLNCVSDKIAVVWSNDPADWKHLDENYVYNYIINNAKDGAIILLHDTKESTVNAVLRAVDVLTDEGFTFARVDDLLCRNGDSLAPGLAYRKCRKNNHPLFF